MKKTKKVKKKKNNLIAKKNYSDNSDYDEDFNCITEKKYKSYFLNFPLSAWITIVGKIYNENMNENLNLGKEYQRTVNLILSQDIFKDYNFLSEEENKAEIEKKIGLNPDFYIEKISNSNIQKILEKREYMFSYDDNFNVILELPKECTLTIIGEICSKLRAKKQSQIQSYCNFIKANKNHILMLIFDFNYENLFESTDQFNNLKDIIENNTPIIFGYIPKLFKEDCYMAYNKIAPKDKKIYYQKYIYETYNLSEIDSLKKKNESSEEEINNLNSIIKAMEEENIKNKEKLEIANKDNEKLRKELEIANKQKDENEKIRKKMEDLKRENEELKNLIKHQDKNEIKMNK